MANEFDKTMVGDRVIGHSGGGRKIREVLTVTKILATQIVCDRRRFKRRNGRLVGASNPWGEPFITIPEPGEIETVQMEVRKDELGRKFGQMIWQSYSLEKLEAVEAALR